jgi:putative inorganic carbon (HCO3(-)) transporter
VRNLFLLLAISAGLCLALLYPYAGVLLWTWIALQVPHEEAYGFVQSAPINLIVALVTIIAWIFSRERKRLPVDSISATIFAFLVWTTVCGFFAFDPSWSWPYWERTWKVFALGLLIAALTTNRVRVQALLWVIVLSLFYYGVKGGVFTIVTGGHFRVQGPQNSIIGDNNQLSVGLLMVLPIAFYLRHQSESKLVKQALLLGIVLSIIAILGSYSRGALIGLATLSFVSLFSLRHRIRYLIAGSLFTVFTFVFMPDSFFRRMHTIFAPGQDLSVHGRLVAWQVAWMYARDHFPFGAGFYGPQLPMLFHSYFPAETPRAAHSIYFQVLGEQGFVGFVLYLGLLLAAFVRCSKIISATRRAPQKEWIKDLVRSIQASLIVFCVSAAALSMAYYDLFVICVALLLPLRNLARQSNESVLKSISGEVAPNLSV